MTAKLARAGLVLGNGGGPGEEADSLAGVRREAGRERLLDMQRRLRPYRLATFAVLALALATLSGEIGWWWLIPLAAGMAVFPITDYFMHRSEHPALWVGAGWAVLPLLIADAIVITGGAESPALMLLALPAITLGPRFELRGVLFGTAYILVLLFGVTYGFDRGIAIEHNQQVVAAAALVVGAVILSGALVESDRAHRRRSTIDSLTGLHNRSALERRLAELDGEPCGLEAGLSHALLLCDLDHFKRVNDRLGHAAGDAVLQDVAYTMRAVLRAGDSIYRVGGEEILVILPGADRDGALEIAERLRLAVKERRPIGIMVTLSIGVAVSLPHAVDADDLVSRADAALYAAKAGGRDTVFTAPSTSAVESVA